MTDIRLFSEQLTSYLAKLLSHISMVQIRKPKLLPPCPRCVARGPAHAVPVRIQCWLVQKRLPPKGRKCLGRPACHFHNFLVSQQRIMLHLEMVAVTQHIQVNAFNLKATRPFVLPSLAIWARKPPNKHGTSKLPIDRKKEPRFHFYLNTEVKT